MHARSNLNLLWKKRIQLSKEGKHQVGKERKLITGRSHIYMNHIYIYTHICDLHT